MLDCAFAHEGSHYEIAIRVASGRNGERTERLTLNLPDCAGWADLAIELHVLRDKALRRAHDETQARCRGERPPVTDEPRTAQRCQT